MSTELKIKAKHLALEPRIIKHEARKIGRSIGRYQRQMNNEKSGTSAKLAIQEKQRPLISKQHSLLSHNKAVVRPEARATHLARAFLAGQDYREVEGKRKEDFESLWELKNQILPRVWKMVEKYGNRGHNYTYESVKTWMEL